MLITDDRVAVQFIMPRRFCAERSDTWQPSAYVWLAAFEMECTICHSFYIGRNVTGEDTRESFKIYCLFLPHSLLHCFKMRTFEMDAPGNISEMDTC